MDETQLRVHLDNLADNAGSQRALAKELGISEAFLTDVLRYRRNPGEKLLKALGLRKIILYEESPNG